MNTASNQAVALSSEAPSLFSAILDVISGPVRHASEVVSALDGVEVDDQIEQVFLAKSPSILTATRVEQGFVSGVDPLRSPDRLVFAHADGDDLVLELQSGAIHDCYKIAVWMFKNGPNLLQDMISFVLVDDKAEARIPGGNAFPTFVCLFGPQEITEDDFFS